MECMLTVLRQTLPFEVGFGGDDEFVAEVSERVVCV